MRKTIVLLLLTALASVVVAQEPASKDDVRRHKLQTIQQRNASRIVRDQDFPVAAQTSPSQPKSAKLNERVWYPGEWEEVKAIVITCYYDYLVPGHENDDYWYADPLLSGIADYYHYPSYSTQGQGPYIPQMDTSSSFGKTFFYLMDGIQQGGAEAWVRIEEAADSNKVKRTLARLNLRSDKLRFIVAPGNAFWYRDCGPVCFYYGNDDNVAMMDFEYYPGRALDDSLSLYIHQQMGLPFYLSSLEWEGGNCLVDGAGMVLSSDEIYSNNSDRRGQLTWDGSDPNTIEYTSKPSLSQSQVKRTLKGLLGQRATYILPAFQYDGGTGHIDLYVDMWDENGFVFSQFPAAYSSWTDYATASKNIDSLCSYNSLFGSNYDKTYIPFPCTNSGGNFSNQSTYDRQYTRTYSNHTFVNNVILQPVFSAVSNGQPTAAWDLERFSAIKEAYPGYTLYPVDVREFDGSGGAIHCITKQIPADNPIRILHKSIRGCANALLQRDEDVPVSAVITNKSGIAHAECVYRIAGGDWQTLNLRANGNRFYGRMATSSINPGTTVDSTVTVEYYISATSNNGKTITKPMTAAQGGYYSFYFTNMTDTTAYLDSNRFDFDTTPLPSDDITFVLDNNYYEDPSLSIALPALNSHIGHFYPNPSNSTAHIDIEASGNFEVSIIDVTGRTVHTSSLAADGPVSYNINAQRLPKGIYSVVFSCKGQKVVRRLVVQ